MEHDEKFWKVSKNVENTLNGGDEKYKPGTGILQEEVDKHTNKETGEYELYSDRVIKQAEEEAPNFDHTEYKGGNVYLEK